MWDLLFDWPSLVERGADAAAYFIMAVVGTLLFMIRLGLALFWGADADMDMSMDADVDAGAYSDASFTLFSVLSVLAFMMGAGWMGLACRLDWNLSRMLSAFLAVGFGTTMMGAASGLTYLTRKLNRQIEYDVSTANGKICRVYLTIPARGKGHGQVEVTVSGRKKILRAMSTGPRIEAFADVKVVEVREDETLVVEPLT